VNTGRGQCLVGSGDVSDLDCAIGRSWCAHCTMQRAKERMGSDWIATSGRGRAEPGGGERSTDMSGKFVSVLNTGGVLRYLVVDTRSMSVQPEFESAQPNPKRHCPASQPGQSECTQCFPTP
jgi:hypothetical protein